MEPLPTPPPRPEKLVFEQKLLFPWKKQTKTNKNVGKPMEKPTKSKKTFFFKTMEHLPPPLLVPKSWFLTKSCYFQGKTNKNQQQRCKTNGKTNKT